MGEKEHKWYMRMLNLGLKLSKATGFQGNVSSCDGFSRVSK